MRFEKYSNMLAGDHHHHHQEEDEISRRWWKRVLDMEESKKQLLLSLPMILTNVFYYLIPLISVMFAGHLGQHQLAAATLANSWVTVTGFDFMIGLSGALETLCGQGFGAKLYRLLGIYLQSSTIISFFFSIIISILWFFTEPIMILLHQDPLVSKTAALYTIYLIPGLFAFGFLQNMLRFFQTQSVVMPLIVLSLLPMIFHIGITYSLVHWTGLGFKGAPIAASISLCISILVLALYVAFSKEFKHTWTGFSLESLNYISTNLRLALPSAAMVCLEYWAFEVLVFLAGMMPNSEETTSLIAMCVGTETLAYMLTEGLGATASTRVSNELGAGNPKKAQKAVFVTLKISMLFAIAAVLVIIFGHDIWTGFFSDSSTIKDQFASMTPLIGLSIMADSIQGVLSGVARGCGWQHIAVYVNLATFYGIGMPIAVLLGFKFNLHAKGLWIGLICGLCCQAATFLFITLRTRKWIKLDFSEDVDEENPISVQMNNAILYAGNEIFSQGVSNVLGAGNSDKTSNAMAVSLKLSMLLAVTVDLALFFGHNIWAAGFFSDTSVIIKQFASTTPLLALSKLSLIIPLIAFNFSNI